MSQLTQMLSLKAKKEWPLQKAAELADEASN
jgi:hypothetical protein